MKLFNLQLDFKRALLSFILTLLWVVSGGYFLFVGFGLSSDPVTNPIFRAAFFISAVPSMISLAPRLVVRNLTAHLPDYLHFSPSLTNSIGGILSATVLGIVTYLVFSLIKKLGRIRFVFYTLFIFTFIPGIFYGSWLKLSELMVEREQLPYVPMTQEEFREAEQKSCFTIYTPTYLPKGAKKDWYAFDWKPVCGEQGLAWHYDWYPKGNFAIYQASRQNQHRDFDFDPPKFRSLDSSQVSVGNLTGTLVLEPVATGPVEDLHLYFSKGETNIQIELSYSSSSPISKEQGAVELIKIAESLEW